MYAHLRNNALDKDPSDRGLSDYLAISRAERPDEWDMDEFIKNALALEKRILILEEGLKEIRNSVIVQSPNWIACRVDTILKLK